MDHRALPRAGLEGVTLGVAVVAVDVSGRSLPALPPQGSMTDAVSGVVRERTTQRKREIMARVAAEHRDLLLDLAKR